MAGLQVLTVVWLASFHDNVAQISWQPGSANELMQMVSMVCKQVYEQDLEWRPQSEHRARDAVKGRLESMGATTKKEGRLREEYPSYRTLYGPVLQTTRSSKRYDLLVTFRGFQVQLFTLIAGVIQYAMMGCWCCSHC